MSETVKKTKKTTTSTSRRSQKKPNNGSSRFLLIIVAFVVVLVVYRQVFLASMVRASVPEMQLQTALENCASDKVSLKRLSSLQSMKAKESIGISSSLGGLQGIFKDILSGISSGIVDTKITQQYISEIKILQLEDLLGNNAQLRINGTLDLQYTVPVIGILEEKKEYKLTLNKRGDVFNFLRVSVKKPDEEKWTTWECDHQL